jgi:hypothetical protein
MKDNSIVCIMSSMKEEGDLEWKWGDITKAL